MAFSSRLKSNSCKECGMQCDNCADQTNLHLHVEIENLKQRLLEREHHIVSMETNFLNEAEKFPNGEFSALTEELLTWQEKYSRLYESHKRVQKVNQSLEDKLLRIVDKCETEKNLLTQDLSCLTQRLVDSKSKVKQLEDENERYRNDVNLAIQLLQCKPTNFVSQKFDTLSPDLQLKVRSYIGNKRSDNGGGTPKPEPKIIKVPIPTFPPTAMVYSLNNPSDKTDREDSSEGKVGGYKQPVDIVSAAIMAKVLEERARERLYTKHCETCTCSSPQQNTSSATNVDQKDTLTFTNNIANSSNRGSQGFVRYVDVVTTRNANESVEASQRLESNCETSFLCGTISKSPILSHAKNVKFVSSSNAKSSVSPSIVPSVRNIETMKLKDLKLLSDVDGQHAGDGQRFDFYNPNSKDGNILSGSSSDIKSSTKSADDVRSAVVKVNVDEQDDSLWSNFSTSSESPTSSQVSIDIESGMREQTPAFTMMCKSRESLFSSSNESSKRLQSYLDKSEPTRPRIQEGRTFLSDKINNKSVAIPKTFTTNRADVTSEVQCKTPGRRVGLIQRTPRQVTDVAGPRACSLRMQAGTSNILLANATCYTPVLYTSRPDVLVHTPRSRSTSASSTET